MVRVGDGSTQPIAGQGGAAGVRPGGAPPNGGGASFADALRSASTRAGEVRFSGHALQRIERRDIAFDATRLARLEEAISKAEAKGSRDSIVLIDELALVVSVRNRTVITAVDAAHRKENVFTNIDSVVIN